ncbi:CRISPR-associated endonuclease Cas2 [Fervidobacterium sp. 2310opik-2]|uniref:CRISPR-associated endonuclease Cas2 n=1 Tax=Fervidobacterium sp. 2310opik-2 TaxID=1755815 RepID=UPI0013E0667E|nr:CRISPR-associated protein Cas2 [Fervidobacterium sp. 2310opik-2]
MFLIVTYDVNEKRVNKVRKILKKYFIWVQNSVFEGEITFGKLEKCKRELLSVIEKDEDSIYFYEIEFKNACNKKILGQEKNYDSIIL